MIDNTMLDDQPVTERLLMLVPDGVEPDAGFPLKISRVDTKGLLRLLVAEETKYPLAVTVAADAVEPLVKLAPQLDIDVRVLDGLNGDYPTYWRMQTATLPHVAAAELKAAAHTQKMEREARGPKLDMKGLKADQVEKIKELAQDEWSAE